MLSSAGRGTVAAVCSVVLVAVTSAWQIATAGGASGGPSGCTVNQYTQIGECKATVGGSSSSSAPPGRSTGPTCVFLGTQIPCSWPDDGYWWDASQGCWVGPADDITVPNNQQQKGWYYKSYCPDPGWTTTNQKFKIIDIWRLNPPPTQPSPVDLAKKAVAMITMRGPTIGIEPAQNGSGLVGMPVWMWTVQSPQTWGPQSKSAGVTGLSVTATATAKSISWDMGDGHTVTCQNPGTQYSAADGLAASPNCGYSYTQPSGGMPNGVYPIKATTTWQVTWLASTGQAGAFPDQLLSSTTTVKIGELQVVNK